MTEQKPVENKMGTMPVNKLLITMSLPMMVAMLVQAMYNVVDSVFVAQIDAESLGLAAVSMAFPVQSLMIAFATGTGVGVNALLSRRLGEKKLKEASLTAKNGIFVILITYIVFALFGIFGSRLFFSLQTTDIRVIEMGVQYLSVCCIFSFGLFLEIILERLLQSTGKTIYTMFTQGAGAIINIIFDPLLIFGIGPFPKMGVQGAAVATVAGQIVAAALAFLFNHWKNHEINISMKKFRPHGQTIRQIYSVGIPSIIMQSIVSIMTFGMNKILMIFPTQGTVAVSVFGVYFKLQSFIFMPVFGLNNGMVPIIAYNYGAKNKQRITQTIKLSIIIAVGFMVVGLLIFQLLPDQLLLLFNASKDMLEIGGYALRIISLSFIFAGFSIIIISVFQALGNGVYSLVISAARQLVIILPVAYLLAVTAGLHSVWFAFPIAELCCVILCFIMLRHIYNQKIKQL